MYTFLEQTQNVSNLFLKWITTYPDSRLAKQARYLIDNHFGFGSEGHFFTAIKNGNIDSAFVHADIENLKILEQLTGTTLREYETRKWNLDPVEEI